jgi:hypothetical protein
MYTMEKLPKSKYNMRPTDTNMVCQFIVDGQTFHHRHTTELLADECHERAIMVYSTSSGVYQPFAYGSLAPKKQNTVRAKKYLQTHDRTMYY